MRTDLKVLHLHSALLKFVIDVQSEWEIKFLLLGVQ